MSFFLVQTRLIPASSGHLSLGRAVRPPESFVGAQLGPLSLLVTTSSSACALLGSALHDVKQVQVFGGKRKSPWGVGRWWGSLLNLPLQLHAQHGVKPCWYPSTTTQVELSFFYFLFFYFLFLLLFLFVNQEKTSLHSIAIYRCAVDMLLHKFREITQL